MKPLAATAASENISSKPTQTFAIDFTIKFALPNLRRAIDQQRRIVNDVRNRVIAVTKWSQIAHLLTPKESIPGSHRSRCVKKCGLWHRSVAEDHPALLHALRPHFTISVTVPELVTWCVTAGGFDPPPPPLEPPPHPWTIPKIASAAAITRRETYLLRRCRANGRTTKGNRIKAPAAPGNVSVKTTVTTNVPGGVVGTVVIVRAPEVDE